MPIRRQGKCRAQVLKAGPVSAVAECPRATGSWVDVDSATKINRAFLHVGARGRPARIRCPPRRVHRDAIDHAHLQGTAVIQYTDPRRLVAEESKTGAVAVRHIRRVQDDCGGRYGAVDSMR